MMSSDRNVQSLLEACQSEDSHAQIQAIQDLARLGATESVDTLLMLVGSADEFVRGAAARALGALGQSAPLPAGAALERLLDDADESVRNAAAEALGVLGHVPAREALERVVRRDDDWVVRASAAEALGHIGDARALDALEGALSDDYYPVRCYAAVSIGLLGDATTLPLIRRRLTVETHPAPRGDLLVQAIRFGDESAFDDLIALIREQDVEFAHEVLRVVGDLLMEETPSVVARRATEMDHELAGLAARVSSHEAWTAELRARLAELARAATPG